MAFPTGTMDSTDLADLIPKLWGSKVNNFYKSKLVTAKFFVDRSEELVDGGNVIYTPNLTEMAATAKTNGAAVTLNDPTETKVTLTVSTWMEVSFNIEDREAAAVKHSYYIMDKYAQNAGYTIAKGLEQAITALFATFTTGVGASTANVADSDIRSAIAELEAVNVDTSSDVAFFFDSKVFWNQLQAIDKFSLAVNAPVQDPVAKKPDGHLYGIPTYVSNNIAYISGSTGRYNALAHRDAIHFATLNLGSGGSMGGNSNGEGIRLQSNYVPEYLSTLTTADMVYGVVLNRATSGIAILSAE